MIFICAMCYKTAEFLFTVYDGVSFGPEAIYGAPTFTGHQPTSISELRIHHSLTVSAHSTTAWSDVSCILFLCFYPYFLAYLL